VKNVTISIPDEAYRDARIYAAENNTSVSALVREIMVNLRAQHERFRHLMRQQNETIASIGSFSAADRLTRDEVHDRDALRRLEHTAVRDK
jgi:hypothetical protein